VETTTLVLKNELGLLANETVDIEATLTAFMQGSMLQNSVSAKIFSDKITS
jgi:hypothetical protein